MPSFSSSIQPNPTQPKNPAGAQAGRRGRRSRAGALLPPAPVQHEARGRHQGRRRRHGLVRLLARGAEQRVLPFEGCGHGDGISGGVQGGPRGKFFRCYITVAIIYVAVAGFAVSAGIGCRDGGQQAGTCRSR